MQVIANDRLGRKDTHRNRSLRVLSSDRGHSDTVRVKCSPEDTVGDLKRLIAAQTGTDHRKIQLKKWCVYPPL